MCRVTRIGQQTGSQGYQGACFAVRGVLRGVKLGYWFSQTCFAVLNFANLLRGVINLLRGVKLGYWFSGGVPGTSSIPETPNGNVTVSINEVRRDGVRRFAIRTRDQALPRTNSEKPRADTHCADGRPRRSSCFARRNSL